MKDDIQILDGSVVLTADSFTKFVMMVSEKNAEIKKLRGKLYELAVEYDRAEAEGIDNGYYMPVLSPKTISEIIGVDYKRRSETYEKLRQEKEDLRKREKAETDD